MRDLLPLLTRLLLVFRHFFLFRWTTLAQRKIATRMTMTVMQQLSRVCRPQQTRKSAEIAIEQGIDSSRSDNARCE